MKTPMPINHILFILSVFFAAAVATGLVIFLDYRFDETSDQDKDLDASDS